MTKILFLNDIKLPEKDKFSEQFNKCSDLLAIYRAQAEDSEEQKQAWDAYFNEKLRLETGNY